MYLLFFLKSFQDITLFIATWHVQAQARGIRVGTAFTHRNQQNKTVRCINREILGNTIRGPNTVTIGWCEAVRQVQSIFQTMKGASLDRDGCSLKWYSASDTPASSALRTEVKKTVSQVFFLGPSRLFWWSRLTPVREIYSLRCSSDHLGGCVTAGDG